MDKAAAPVVDGAKLIAAYGAQLRDAVRALSVSPGQQIAEGQASSFSLDDIAYELWLYFDHSYDAADFFVVRGQLSPDSIWPVSRLKNLVDTIVGCVGPDFWECRALSTHPGWRRIRACAAELLAELEEE